MPSSPALQKQWQLLLNRLDDEASVLPSWFLEILKDHLTRVRILYQDRRITSMAILFE